MNNQNPPTPHDAADDFDVCMQREFARVTPVGTIPPSLFRSEPRWHIPRMALCSLAMAGILIAACLALQPPSLVRAALAHERNERTVRGNFMPSQLSVAGVFGLPSDSATPGLLQMAKPCVIAGRVAYHLTTWLDGVEGGGMVTAISFAQPIALSPRSGWWPDSYWRIIYTQRGTPVMLFAQNSRAVDAAAVRFR